MARDQELLKNARLDNQRYKLLWEQDSISRQQLDTQEALVRQYEGAVKIDQGLIDSAENLNQAAWMNKTPAVIANIQRQPGANVFEVVDRIKKLLPLRFRLNNLMLMALTISTGFVVDDAIVVIENIARFVEEGETLWQAALKGVQQIGFTILSLTDSLIAGYGRSLQWVQKRQSATIGVAIATLILA